MRTLRQNALAALTLCALSVGCRPPDNPEGAQPIEGAGNAAVHVLFDNTRPLPVAGTYGWGISLLRIDPAHKVKLSEVEERLHGALLNALPAEGFIYTNTAPDYLVGFAIMVGDSVNEADINAAYGNLLAFPERTETTPALNYGVGVLVLDVVERERGHLLWRGAIKADIDLNLPDEKKQARCDGAVRELLRHYPVPPGTR